jgi:5'-methylthioadenosine phosphorylase
MAKVGVLGGSGLYHIEGITDMEEQSLLTPFGEPSCNFVTGRLDDVEVVFLPRHGKGHKISPGEINYRANIFGMKKLGVDAIISVSACGSLKEGIKPMDFVIPDQFVDLTKGNRVSTFFTEGIVAHAAFAEPVAPELRAVLFDCIKGLGLPGHNGGTYVNIEGPQFSTIAESNIYRQWGMDIIGMTNATEAKLAREAEISYVTLAAVTDYDCWYQSHESVTVEMIIDNLNKNITNARKILQKAIPVIGRMEHFSAQGAMQHAVITAPDGMPEEKKKELEILIGKYVN